MAWESVDRLETSISLGGYGAWGFFCSFLSLGIGIACLLDLARFLRIATDNLDLVCSEFLAAVAFESHVLNQKCPDVIAESVGLEMALS